MSIKFVFEIAGPFPIPFKSGSGSSKHIEKEHVQQFWLGNASVCASGVGCYIFAKRAGKGHTPWYVGKSSKGFSKEAFTADKLTKYNKVLFDDKKGTPCMFFIKHSGKKTVDSAVLKEMETYLIQMAFMKNADLVNIHGKKDKSQWSIPDITHTKLGKKKPEASAFRKAMGAQS
jgi:hypothetical protein